MITLLITIVCWVLCMVCDFFTARRLEIAERNIAQQAQRLLALESQPKWEVLQNQKATDQ